MGKPDQKVKTAAKKLTPLFAARDKAKPSSKQEKTACEAILKGIFSGKL